MIERVLIAGLGSIGKRHARIVRELLPQAQIVALRHRNGGSDQPADVDHCVTSIEEALRFRPQVAVIANPANLHLKTAGPLAEAGVHLLLEKPISNSVDGVADLIRVGRERRIILMVGYNLRFFLSLQSFRRLVKDQRCGRVLSVHAEVGQFLPSWRPHSDYRTTVSANARLGGGVLLELSHEIDYLHWLFGDVDWVSAIQRRQSALEIDVDDTAHLVMAFAAREGERPVLASLNMDFIRHDATRTCTVIGNTGSLRWNGASGVVDLFEQDSGAWRTVFAHHEQRDDSYRAEWQHFIQCIASGDAPMISGDDGLAVLRVVEAAQKSSALAAAAVAVQAEELGN